MKSLKSTFLNRARNTKKRGNKRRHTRPTLKGGIAKIPSPTLNTRTRVIPVHPRLPTRRRELVGEESRVSERESSRFLGAPRREILPVQNKKGKFGYMKSKKKSKSTRRRAAGKKCWACL